MKNKKAPHMVHAATVARMATLFADLGISYHQVYGYSDWQCCYDFTVQVGGRTQRIAVRTGWMKKRSSWTKSGNWEYRYHYEAAFFNLGPCRRRTRKHLKEYTDFFVCVPTNNQGRIIDRIYVIPWDALAGKKSAYITRSTRERPYRGKYAKFREAWSLLS